ADLRPDRDAVLAALWEYGDRLRARVTRRLEVAQQRLDAVADRPVLRNPLDRIRGLEERLDGLDDRLRRAGGLPIEGARTRVAAPGGPLESPSPLNGLSRGDRLTRPPAERCVHDAPATRPDDVIHTRLARGELVSRVEKVHPAEETP